MVNSAREENITTVLRKYYKQEIHISKNNYGNKYQK